jgi:hypothetical protein
MVTEIIAGYAAFVATLALVIPIWQARRARYPRLELQLIHTQGPGVRAIFLEVRNRGEHPVRVVTAAIRSPDITYDFEPDGITISHRDHEVYIESKNRRLTNTSPDSEWAWLPGIILPHDAGSRMLATNMVSLESVDAELLSDVIASVEQEITGWVVVSTGELIHTKPVKYKWPDFY